MGVETSLPVPTSVVQGTRRIVNPEGAELKYLILIYSNPQSWGHPAFSGTPEFLAMSRDERDQLTGQFGALMKEIAESGELIDAQPLADAVHTKTIRVREGVPAITDGPYPEAKEQLAGYFVVDCDSPQRATEIAARFPDAQFAAVVVRPIMDLSGQEM